MIYLRWFALSFLLSLASLSAVAQTVIPDANITFTTIDVPGAGYTGVWAINTAGDMVGNYGQDTNVDSHGFLYSNGTFTYIDYPGQSVTVARGINDSNLIVGYAGRSTVVGFLYDGTVFTTIQHGSDSATYADGINNAGEIVGGTGTIYSTKGFEVRGSRFKVLKVPGPNIYVSGSGVNNFGVVVGWTDDNGFKCRAGQCQIFNFPGATRTVALGINDSGIMVGWYDMAPFTYAFATKNGKYISFRYPGADFTSAAGINKSGQIVGQYTSDYQAFHGFVTSPITAADFE
jgi:uncharacterized membrane protein